MAEQESVVLVEGPWTHRDVAANGARFHAAEMGTGPLVLLLHGFPQFWWTWRDQIGPLSAAGYRVVAPDLRGYGASDKPPRGYDLLTLAEDVAGMIRALGERDAVVVGHDWGALLGWTVATRHPRVVRGLVTVSMPHPLELRSALFGHPAQLRASAWVLGCQLPRLPERWLTQDGAAQVGTLLRQWFGRREPAPAAVARYREAMGIPGVAHSAMEYYRWFVRSFPRPDGLRVSRVLHDGVSCPTLHVHGRRDRCILPGTAAHGARYVRGPYTERLLAGVGHFPQEEAPEEVAEILLAWLGPGAAASPQRDQASRDRDARDRDGRDRDERGRPRNARPRDASGRPLPRGAAGRAPGPDSPALPPALALAEAERLIEAGEPFAAHEVLEAVWKEAPASQRELWRGLAQMAVGLTHAQRGNVTGAERLLRRGADRVAEWAAGRDGSAPEPAEPGNGAGGYAAGPAEPDAQRPGDQYAGDIPPLALPAVVARARDLADRLGSDGLAQVSDADLRLALR